MTTAYLWHLWNNPLSASEQLKAEVLVGLPLIALAIIGGILFKYFWDWYNQ